MLCHLSVRSGISHRGHFLSFHLWDDGSGSNLWSGSETVDAVKSHVLQLPQLEALVCVARKVSRDISGCHCGFPGILVNICVSCASVLFISLKERSESDSPRIYVSSLLCCVKPRLGLLFLVLISEEVCLLILAH